MTETMRKWEGGREKNRDKDTEEEIVRDKKRDERSKEENSKHAEGNLWKSQKWLEIQKGVRAR